MRRESYQSDMPTGRLNSDVAPSVVVTVAVKPVGTLPVGASTVMENADCPRAAIRVSPRNISPSVSPVLRLPNSSIVVPSGTLICTRPVAVNFVPSRTTFSITGAAMPWFGGPWHAGSPSGQIFVSFDGSTGTPPPRSPT